MKHVLCKLGAHKPGWVFVGDSWNPDLYVKVCTRCGDELYDGPTS
jgi:hypothetical protein